jgi:transposase InsO family protein
VRPVLEEAAMLIELSMVEQRYLAVREALDSGATIVQVAAQYGVDRRTLHRWLTRYANGGLEALADRSSRPDTSPTQMDPRIEARLVMMRRQHPGWGPRTLRTKLVNEFGARAPSRSAVYRALVRHQLIVPAPRRRRAEDYQRFERTRSMEMWQMDVVGRIYLTDGTSISCVTGIDDHSRYCVSAQLVERATARPVCDALLLALQRYGPPEEILTDNGRVFTGKHQTRPATVLFDRICLNNGIKHRLTAPYHPTTTGKVERLHRTMRDEFFSENRFDTIEETQVALDKWVVEYNTQREHQSLGDTVPLRRFELARSRENVDIIDGDVETEPAIATRKSLTRVVDDKGRVSVLTFRYHVGRVYSGERVQVTSEDGLLYVHHRDVLIATHARRHLVSDDVAFSVVAQVKAPTKGGEVFRAVDNQGAVSFAGIAYRAGNAYRGMTASVSIVGDTVQITVDGVLIRTHKARHDRSKEFGALAMPNGKPRRKDVA